MKLTYFFRHLDFSKALTEYTKEQLLEVSRFLLKDGFGHAHYSKVHHQFCVEIAVNTRERYFKAKAHDTDPYAAVDQAIAKLETQFKKVKKVIKNHKRPELSRQGRMKHMNHQFEFTPRFKKAA